MTARTEYSHHHWEGIRRFLRFLMNRVGFRILAKIDLVEGVENIPSRGAGIVFFNHTSFIDSVAVLNAIPRNAVPIARFDFGNIPFWGIFPKLWGAIPIRRGEVDRGALEKAVEVLQAGELLLMAPEGTRSHAMRRAKDGMAYLAARTGAPVIPAGVTGTEGFPSIHPGRWAQPGAHIRFGRPFRFRIPEGKVPREYLRTMTDEAMCRLAALLPPERRGYYGDPALATSETIEAVAP
jgi:1-acyl-sn-glycerol-3-phosphate acyltransferase